MKASFRQGQILQLVRDKRIHTQEELARELAAIGVPATQVTLSRDIKKLGLAKTAEGYLPLDAASAAPPHVETIIGEFLREVRSAQNLVVLKCGPGQASTLAVEIDSSRWPEVVGTLAGDDTVLVVTPDTETAARLRERLLKMIA